MNVLVACEFSGVVRDAFRAKGHSAWSCDLLPAESKPHLHIQGDALEAIRDGRPTDGAPWDMMICHPPCTHLAVSGARWFKDKAQEQAEALEFARSLMNAPIPCIALENPVSIISSRIRKPDQTIQPWQFGHDASKKTCLWLKGLPQLVPTSIVPPKGWQKVKYAFECMECPDCGEPWCEECEEHYGECSCIGPTQDEATHRTIDGVQFATLETPAPRPIWGNQTPSGQNKLGPSPDRWRERSRTFPGIAQAMADQWGSL